MNLIKSTEPMTKMQASLKNKTQDALTAVRLEGEGGGGEGARPLVP